MDVALAGGESGLSSAQVSERAGLGYANTPLEPPTRTVRQIVLGNLLTYFNLIFFLLASCIIAVGSWNDLMFMPVVFANIAIGIVQELRSKKTLDKLTLISAPRGVAVRDGALKTVTTDKLVRDDIVVFATGNQIYADAELVSGEVQVNEALITGEADEIKKGPGDELLSGSFVVSGMCRARLTRVGADSYAAKLTLEAKKSKKRGQSEMMRSLSKLVKWIGIVIIPLGAIMAYKEIWILGRPVPEGVVSTVGALVGMIPEGLYLLTSLALAAGVMRLMQRKTLVHEMRCIETLARVDVLCVDKTGTITENKMIVDDLCLLREDRFIEDDIRMIMSDYVFNSQDDNETMTALRRYFTGAARQTAVKTLPFTSSRKYGGVSFDPEETYLLGAPDVILGAGVGEYREKIEYYSSRGCRVLLLSLFGGDLDSPDLNAELMPLALILLTNKIRPEAPETFRFFERQGVAVKVISGDSALTVSEVAKKAEIANSEKYVDAQTLDTDAKLERAAAEYTVFGRVSPDQKRRLVRYMRKAGHTVAMTGDGVNDVLALKEADCSIAMASGSDVACQVSNIVLLSSDFSSMPSVVMEGRRVINNIERAAALFLVKNIFSFSLALLSLFFAFSYPVTPSQLSLVSTITIGIPSFILALEPNVSLVKGRFLTNVILRALPAGLTDLIVVAGVLLFYFAFPVEYDEMTTICALLLGVVGLMMLFRTCRPFTQLRKILMAAMLVAFILAAWIMRELFTLVSLSYPSVLVLIVFILLAGPIMYVITKAEGRVSGYMRENFFARKKGGRARQRDGG